MSNLEKAFHKMKADIQIKEGPRPPVTRKFPGRQRVVARPTSDRYTVDVKNGKFIFDLGESGAKVTVQDADPEDRHILVNVQTEVELTTRNGDSRKEIKNDKWLCGHDERDWFVAGATGISIWEAKQNLKPKEVQALDGALPNKKKHKRRNKVFLRQGEWFFVRASEGEVPKDGIIHKDEPMSRPGGGKPHTVEEVVRVGGRVVYADSGGNILTPEEYEKLESHSKYRYTQRRADATVYGRGYVKHRDHETLHLDGWHRIYMNAEKRDGKALIFLD
jgi:hypothetical protein